MNTSPRIASSLLLGATLSLGAASACPAAGLGIAFSAGGATLSDTPVGAPAPSGGTYYSGSLVLPAADATFESIAVDAGDISLSGTLVVTNHLPTPVEIDIDITLGLAAPSAAFIRRGSLVGLVPFGGSISSQPSQLMHELLADGAASPGLLPAAYSSSAAIGPVAALDGSDMVTAGAAASVGHRWQFVLAADARVVLHATMRTQSLDLDGDGAVGGGDLGQLLSGWGQPGAADFNGDGIVDSADLGLLLSAWG